MKRRRERNVSVKKENVYSGILYRANLPTVTERELTLADKKRAQEKKRAKLNKLTSFMEKMAGKVSAFFAKAKSSLRSFTRGYEAGGDNRKFYISVAASAAALVAITLVCTSGILEPPKAQITVNDTGRIVSADTRAKTVGEFLEKNQITLEEGDVLEVAADMPIADGMEIVIRRALPLTIVNGGEETQVKLLAGTVQEALERAGVEVSESDEVYPAMSSYISSGTTINIIKVTEQTITEDETLYYKEVTKSDSKLAKGKKQVVTEGENGLQRHTIKIVYKNGIEVSRTEIGVEVVKQPVDQVVHIGTYVAPVSKPQKPSSTSKPSNPTGGGDAASEPTDDSGKRTSVPSVDEIHQGNLYEHGQAAPPASSIIAKTVVIDKITAYTDTGNATATGTYPRMGTIAADPNRFPYGTKVYVPGYGYGRIEDTGGFRNASYTQFDLFMYSESDCRNWGVKRSWKVYILK